MPSGKPIIGILGGIGSGKSFVARIFGEMGCLVINSDEQVRDAYLDPKVKQTLKEWWGDAVFDGTGEINRAAIAQRVFANPAQRQRLEQYLHPLVFSARDRIMADHAGDAQVLAFVWDTPLLLETGAHADCDVLVFVDAPLQTRLSRVQQSRGWDASELESREKLQLPLDKKREISDYVIDNTAGTKQSVRAQVREVLSRILAGSPPTARPH
jgi:dephospho-CoA kinase